MILRPIHCPPSRDCRRWAFDQRDRADETGHVLWLHDERAGMLDAFGVWLTATHQMLANQASIEALTLPDPNDPTLALDCGLVDPSTVAFILGWATIYQLEARGVYFGVVLQDPFGTWRGACGFFLSWCEACDPGGDRLLKRSILSRLAALGVAAKSIWELPAPLDALRPRPRWFADDLGQQPRLLYGGLLSARSDLAPGWLDLEHIANCSGSALVAIAPVVVSTSNLIYVDDLESSLDALKQFTPAGVRMTARTGSPERLAELAGVRESEMRIKIARSRRDVPAAWGAFISRETATVFGPVSNLEAALRTHRFKRAPITIAYLAPGRATSLVDIQRLTPALSAANTV